MQSLLRFDPQHLKGENNIELETLGGTKLLFIKCIDVVEMPSNKKHIGKEGTEQWTDMVTPSI